MTLDPTPLQQAIEDLKDESRFTFVRERVSFGRDGAAYIRVYDYVDPNEYQNQLFGTLVNAEIDHEINQIIDDDETLA
jgi:hypothetical protein